MGILSNKEYYMVNFYPDRDVMIDVLIEELPIEMDYASGDDSQLCLLWDKYQEMKAKYPDKEERDKRILVGVMEVLKG